MTNIDFTLCFRYDVVRLGKTFLNDRLLNKEGIDPWIVYLALAIEKM